MHARTLNFKVIGVKQLYTNICLKSFLSDVEKNLMFKLKCDDFLIYDETTGTYSMAPEQQVGTKLSGTDGGARASEF